MGSFTLFVALNNPNDCQYYVDQPITCNGRTTYPDIFIVNEHNYVTDLIDVKTDLGWNRNGMMDFCRDRESLINQFKNQHVIFKIGKSKEIKHSTFDQSVKYHILIISLVNSGKEIIEQYPLINKKLTNIELYILSRDTHPNSYKYPQDELIDQIKIDESEFHRLFFRLNRKFTDEKI